MAPKTKKRKLSTAQAVGNGKLKRACRRADDRSESDRLIAAGQTLETAETRAKSLATRWRPERIVARRLSSICLDVVARSFSQLFLDSNHHKVEKYDQHRRAIKNLPHDLLGHLFHLVLQPGVPCFTPQNLVDLFFGPKLTQLAFTAVRINREFLNALPSCTHLTKLNLSSQVGLDQHLLARSLRRLSCLQELDLSGCVNIRDWVVIAVAETSNSQLLAINLNFTGVSTKVLIILFGRCPSLQVLKLANVAGLKDEEVQRIVDQAIQLAQLELQIPLSRLKTLKLKCTSVGNAGLDRLLSLCAQTLERLDISYTKVERLDVLARALFQPRTPPDLQASSASHSNPCCKLVKLVISGLSIPLATKSREKQTSKTDLLIEFFENFASQPKHIRDRFQILKMAFMGVKIERLQVHSTGQHYLDLVRLDQLIPFLYKFGGLRRVSLRGNDLRARQKILKNPGDVLARFISLVGRRCEVLDLRDVCYLDDSILLSGLGPLSEELHPPLGHDASQSDDDHTAASKLSGLPRIKTLLLDKTNITEGSALAIATCRHLEQLFVRETKMTSEGLKLIIKGCPHLCVLDLTSCRGVPLRDRRDFFESLEADDS